MECSVRSVRLGQHGYGQYVTRIVFLCGLYFAMKAQSFLFFFSANNILTGFCTNCCAACLDEHDRRRVVLSFIAINELSFGLQEEMEEKRNVERALSWVTYLLHGAESFLRS